MTRSSAAAESMDAGFHPPEAQVAVRPPLPADGIADDVLSLQRLAGNQAVADLLAAAPGMPLDAGVRNDFQSQLGADFGDVQVHMDAKANRSASAFDALAYSIGNHIVFSEGAYAPHTAEGRLLLCHELVHVVQQRRGGPPPSLNPASASERDADAVASAVALGQTFAPVSQGTAVGIARQPMDPRHARGYAGEQGMGFEHYQQEEGWIFFEGPSGSSGHSVTARGFDGIAYNIRDDILELVDNKSLKSPGDVYGATAIDPSKNLPKNVDALIKRVMAARDTPRRFRMLQLLRQTKAALAAGKPLPSNVKLVVTSVGGQTTDVSARLKALGVEHKPTAKKAKDPAVKAPTTEAAPTPKTAPAPKVAPEPAPPRAEPAVPTPPEAPTPATPQTSTAKPPSVAPLEQSGGPSVTPKPGAGTFRGSPLRAGLKAGAKAAGWMILFAGLEYYVHKKKAEELEANIEKAKRSFRGLARLHKAEHPELPVYLTVTVRAEEYSLYIPFYGWVPETFDLGIWRVALSTTRIESPIMTVDDHSLNPLRPGKTTFVTYSEPLLP